ncbi:MAG TPA: tRNA (adenosine(37)-N6)-threonylcarbamoyltransferase complex ATPase subunit type 1 TsaE [Thermoleophilia bacterium]|nr:tRNA (adenosine(37)-N6)-threonylcarbamoyltransferase complex ATPase subunit type 1 TsaE [Thermoleophilia bacterium]
MITATLTSPEATGRFARLLAARLTAPALVTLRGDLGTGKTTVVRDVFEALGVDRVVASPSFTLAQSYVGRDGLRLHHLDLYRLAPGADVELFAWEDYLDGSALTFVEWPEAGAAQLPPAEVDLLLSHRSLDSRGLTVRADPALEAVLADELAVVDGVSDVALTDVGPAGDGPSPGLAAKGTGQT